MGTGLRLYWEPSKVELLHNHYTPLDGAALEDLDCSGDDSGAADCWSDWLTIGVSILSVVIFIAMITVMYFIKPNVPGEDQEATEHLEVEMGHRGTFTQVNQELSLSHAYPELSPAEQSHNQERVSGQSIEMVEHTSNQTFSVDM